MSNQVVLNIHSSGMTRFLWRKTSWSTCCGVSVLRCADTMYIVISHPQSGFQENGLPADNRKRERTRRHVACDLCGKVFRDVYHLNRHKLSHSGEKPYACPVCGLRFKRKDRMSYHVRSHDRGGSVGCSFLVLPFYTPALAAVTRAC